MSSLHLNSHSHTKDYYGKCFIKIIEARNTLALDITGTSDPYCLVTLLEEGQEYDKNHCTIFKTEVIYKTLNPHWKDEEFVFDVTKSSTCIFIEMWDEDRLSKDDRMGQIKINLDEYRNRGIKDIWIPLEGKKPGKKHKNRGDIHIQLYFSSYDKFINLLNNENNLIPKAVSKIILTDDFTKSLLYTLSTHSSIVGVITDILTVEIDSTLDPKVLFRTDSLATKLTVSFFKLIGFNYLNDTLQKHILNITTNNVTFEVDPSKGVQEADIEVNFNQFLHHCQIFLDAITVSDKQFPEPLRYICNHILSCVEKKFPWDNNNIKSVGGFVFLRFINPALFSPDSLKLISQPPSTDTRRSLTLITKILQNISNQLVFSSKEKYLERSNAFISNKADEVITFLLEISKPTTTNCRDMKFDCFKSEPIKLIKYFDTIIESIDEKRNQVLESLATYAGKDDQEFITDFTNEISCHTSLIQKQKNQSKKKLEHHHK